MARKNGVYCVTDIKDLVRSEINGLLQEMKAEIGELKGEMKAQFAEVRADIARLDQRVQRLEHERILRS